MLNFLVTDTYLGDDIRSLLALFNIGIYDFIAKMYNLIMDLANVCVFSAELISSMAIKVYTLIGVVMLFTLSIALIQYLIDPEKISDKQMGGSAIVKRIGIAIVLIIIVPSFFSLLYRAQSALITDHVIENLVLGGYDEEYKINYSIDDSCYNPGDQAVTVPEITDIGEYIALNVFAPFFQITTGEDGDVKDLAHEHFVNKDSAFIDYCEATSVTSLLSNPDIVISPNVGGDDGVVSGEYRIDFNGLMALIVGLCVLGLFVVTAMDIATRSIKLGFLQLVAPVPILGYISPSKKQSDMLGKWFQEVAGTWGDLFIRLIGLNLIVLILSEISSNALSIGINPDYVRQTNGTFLLNLFVIIGGLIFAKKLPSIIEQIFGFKFSGGSFSINPLKKLENDAMFGKQIAGVTRAVPRAVAAGATGAAGFVIGNKYKKEELEGKNKERLEADKHLNKSKSDLFNFNANNGKKLDLVKKQKEILERNKEKYSEKYGLGGYKRKMYDLDSSIDSYTKEGKKINDSVVVNQKSFDKADDKYNVTKSKFEDQSSYSSPILGGVMKTARSIGSGAKKGYKSNSIFSGIIKDSYDAAKSSAQTQKYNDQHSITDRLQDRKTDIAGYENESGTSSMIEGDIKKASEELKNITNAIQTLMQQIGRFPGAVTYDGSTGEMAFNDNFEPGNANQRQTIKGLIEEYNKLRESETSKNKEIKKLESLKRKSDK